MTLWDRRGIRGNTSTRHILALRNRKQHTDADREADRRFDIVGSPPQTLNSGGMCQAAGMQRGARGCGC